MTKSAVPHKLLSVEEYLEMEQSSQRRHEYVAGTIYAHAGGTRRHDMTAGNVFALLWSAARGGSCWVYTSDRMLRVAEDVFYYPDVTVFYYPDVTVVCPPEDELIDGQALFEDTPCLLVEVTSPTTRAIDRREKLLAYRKLASLKAYLVVDQEEMRMERHWRDETGQWWQAEAVGPESVVPVPCPETELTLPQIYEGVYL